MVARADVPYCLYIYGLIVTIKRNGNYTERIIYGYLQQSVIVQLTSVHLKKNMHVMLLLLDLMVKGITPTYGHIEKNLLIISV